MRDGNVFVPSMHNPVFTESMCKKLGQWRRNSNPAPEEEFVVDFSRPGDEGEMSFRKDGHTVEIFRPCRDDQGNVDTTAALKAFSDAISHYTTPVQNYVRTQLHQGGELHTGLRLLDSAWGERGVKPRGPIKKKPEEKKPELTGPIHTFVLEQQGNEFHITESVSVSALEYVPMDESPLTKERLDRKGVAQWSSPTGKKRESELQNIRSYQEQLRQTFSQQDDCPFSFLKGGVSATGTFYQPMIAAKLPASSCPENALPAATLFVLKLTHRIKLSEDSQDGVTRLPIRVNDVSWNIYEKLRRVPSVSFSNTNTVACPGLFFFAKKSFKERFADCGERFAARLKISRQQFIFLMLIILLSLLEYCQRKRAIVAAHSPSSILSHEQAPYEASSSVSQRSTAAKR